jgi:hypothetical protein
MVCFHTLHQHEKLQRKLPVIHDIVGKSAEVGELKYTTLSGFFPVKSHVASSKNAVRKLLLVYSHPLQRQSRMIVSNSVTSQQSESIEKSDWGLKY